MSFNGTYDAARVAVLVNGVPIKGSGESTFVSVAQNEDDWTTTVGAKGEVSRSRTNDSSAEVTITLMQTDVAAREYLDGLAKVDKASGLGTFTLSIKDLSNGEAAIARNCWIQSQPDMSFEGEVGEREYIIAVPDLKRV
jgi:hypothetical protein